LLDDEADKILTINRNKFKESKEKREILNHTGNVIQNFFETENGVSFYRRLSENDKAIIAAEYKLQNWKEPKNHYFSDWMELLIQTDKGAKKLNSIIKNDNILYYDKDNFPATDLSELQSFLDEKKINITDIGIARNHGGSTHLLLSELLKSFNFNSTYLQYTPLKVVKISKQKQEPISHEMVIKYCKQTLLENGRSFGFLKRHSIPCLTGYSLLVLGKDGFLPKLTSENESDRINPAFELDITSPRILFPLARIGGKITVGDLDILAKRVYKNRVDKHTSKEQIKQKYQEFIAFLDSLMKNEEDWIKLRGSEFNPAPADNHLPSG